MTEVLAPKKAPYVIAWRDGFKVNIPSVDLEHRHLFMLIAALSLESVEQTVEELLDYVVSHFSNEQALMESSGYPAYAEHLKLHEEFGAQVAEFLANDEPWSPERVQDLRRYLNKWLIGHIMTHDMRFGKWHESHKAINIITAQQQAQPQAQPQQHKGFLARLFGGM